VRWTYLAVSVILGSLVWRTTSSFNLEFVDIFGNCSLCSERFKGRGSFSQLRRCSSVTNFDSLNFQWTNDSGDRRSDDRPERIPNRLPIPRGDCSSGGGLSIPRLCLRKRMTANKTLVGSAIGAASSLRSGWVDPGSHSFNDLNGVEKTTFPPDDPNQSQVVVRAPNSCKVPDRRPEQDHGGAWVVESRREG
jgi:hypothetical protein